MSQWEHKEIEMCHLGEGIAILSHPFKNDLSPWSCEFENVHSWNLALLLWVIQCWLHLPFATETIICGPVISIKWC